MTEAAGAFVTERNVFGGDIPGRVSLDLSVEAGRLVLDVTGSDQRGTCTEERDLSRAVLEAKVDESSPGPGRVRLVKYLDRHGQ